MLIIFDVFAFAPEAAEQKRLPGPRCQARPARKQKLKSNHAAASGAKKHKIATHLILGHDSAAAAVLILLR